MEIKDAIKLFVQARTADGRAPRTIQDYYRVLEPFAEWIAEQPQRQVLTRDVMREYVAHLRSRNWREGTVAIHVRNLRAFLHWLHDEGRIADNLASAIRAPKTSQRFEIPITQEEVQLLIDTCVGDGFHALRDRTMILTMFDAGLRCGEVVRLKAGNWRREGGNTGSYLLVWAPKTDTARFAVLGDHVTQAMTDYMSWRGNTLQNNPLFCQEDGQPIKTKAIESMLLRRAKKAGLERCRVHPHIFRKAFATAFLDNGGDAERLRVLAGWSSMEMVRIYADSSLKRLQEAHHRAGPVDRMMGK